MSDVAKWIILAAGIVTIITMILGFPILSHINVTVFSDGIKVIVTKAGDALMFGRGLVNCFLSPWARTAVSGLLSWLFAKWFFTYSLKILVWAYHFIFK